MKSQMVINRISLVLLGVVILNHVDKVDSSRNCVEQNVSCQHGTCIDSECHCDTGYQGVNCTEKSDCVWNNCSGHGICRSGRCICDDGYRGKHCSRIDCPFLCHGHGTCYERGVCTCHGGYKGEYCSEQGMTTERIIIVVSAIFGAILLYILCFCYECKKCRRCRSRMNDINSEDTRGTRNTFYNLSLHSEVYWSSENNSLFANIPETVVDHRIPIIFGTSPADHRPHALTYDQHQNHSTISIDTLGNSHQLTNDSGGPPTTNEANDFEDQPGACSESVPAQIHQPSETAPYEQLTWLREDNQGDVGEQGPPSYEESMRPYGQLRKGNQEDMDEHGPCPPSYDEFMRQHQV